MCANFKYVYLHEVMHTVLNTYMHRMGVKYRIKSVFLQFFNNLYLCADCRFAFFFAAELWHMRACMQKTEQNTIKAVVMEKW